MNKVLFRNRVSGKSGSGSAFSGKTEEVRVFWQPPGPPLRIRDFSLNLYLRLSKELRRGSFSLIVFCLLLINC